MSRSDTGTTVPTQLTPEERAARKAEAQQKRFNRDRARMLANVQACVKTAGEAIATGDVATHDQWMDAADAAILSYRKFVALTVNTASATAHVDSATQG